MERRKLKRLKENFDVRMFLEDYDIRYWTEGDNVTSGWININCLFCFDHANHMGINLKSNLFSCWLCSETGDAVSLIQKVERCSFQKAVRILEEYQEYGEEKEEEKPDIKKKYKTLLPKHFKEIEAGKEPALVKQWFKKREFDLSICQKYNLGFVKHGEYQLRLIVPVFVDGVVVSWQAVDLTGRASIPYMDCPPDRAKINNKELLYGIDEVEDQLILVEGVTDKWRIGRGAVAAFTKNLSRKQKRFLIERIPKEVLIKVVLDADTVKDKHGEKIAKELVSIYDKVILFELKEGDPADLTKEEIERIRNSERV